MSAFSPLEAIFLAYFDDIKGQTVSFWASADVTQGDIEHAALPSGLHQLDEDLVCFIHQGKPAVGLFRGRAVEGGRGRRMGTLGVVLAEDSGEGVFGVQEFLAEAFDRIETASTEGSSPFETASADSSGPSQGAIPGNQTERILSELWETYRADKSEAGGSGELGPNGDERIRRLADGRQAAHPRSPITYLPALLGLLGPQIIPVYRAALTGQRILIYSTPPLLPLAAFAWCIAATSLPPSKTDTRASAWLGNVGLMDLQSLRDRKGGWVATTSDAIYRSHAVYDLFVDLTVSPPALHSAPLPTSPHQLGRKISYAMSDLPLYRALLLLDTSPATIHVSPTSAASTLSAGPSTPDATDPPTPLRSQADAQSIYARQGGWWLLAFDVFSRAWNLCAGVCAYAVGSGVTGRPTGEIVLGAEDDDRIDEDGEDTQLLPDDNDDEEDNAIADSDQRDGDEAVRRGRLLLRQFHHHSYHLYTQLRSVLGRRRPAELSRADLRELCQARIFSKADEALFWSFLAEQWGFLSAGSGDDAS